jgi:hypothetical protein
MVPGCDLCGIDVGDPVEGQMVRFWLSGPRERDIALSQLKPSDSRCPNRCPSKKWSGFYLYKYLI